MKKRFLSLLLILTLTLFGLAGCVSKDPPPTPVVALTAVNRTIKIGAETDYTSMFTLTVDNKAVTVTADMIDASAADPSKVGSYPIVCAYTDSVGTVHNATATLTVEAYRVAIAPQSIKVVKGETADLKTMFTLTVDDKSVAVTDEMIDGSAVDFARPGDYTVTFRYALAGQTYTQTAVLSVVQSASELAAALERDYSNHIATRVVTDLDGNEIYREIYRVTEAALSYESRIETDSGVEIEKRIYEFDPLGMVRQAYYYNKTTQAWERSPDQGTFVVRADFEGFDAKNFLYAEGLFYAMGDDILALGNAVLGDTFERFQSVGLIVEDGWVKAVRARSVENDGDVFYTQTYTEIGATTVTIPYVEPIVEIAVASERIVTAGDAVDFVSMFTITVDGRAVTADAEMIDASDVDLATPGVYEVRLAYRAPEGKITHNATARLTVKAAAAQERTFTEALLTAAQNSTLTNGTKVYQIDGSVVDYTFGSTRNIFVYEIDGSVTQYLVKDGAVTSTKPNYSLTLATLPNLNELYDLADRFVEGESGVYTYIPAAGAEQTAANTIAGHFGGGMMAKICVSFTLKFENNAITSVACTYKTTATGKESTITYAVTAVGATELTLPAEVVVPQ